MATKYLIASHGRLAAGLASSIDILANMADRLQLINAYVDETDYVPEVQAFLADLSAEDQGIIFTDMMGGSVNQKVFQEILVAKKQDRTFLITNTNLPIVLSILLTEQKWDSEALHALVAEAQVKCIDMQQL